MKDNANLKKNPNLAMHKKRVAGTLPGDGNIEFIGIPSTKEVVWFQFGNQHAFKHLPKKYITSLDLMFNRDHRAQIDIKAMADEKIRQLELYTYFVYGDADFYPDIVNGKLQPAENYRHDENCVSLKWMSKDITINGAPLNTRELKICDLILCNLPDKAIASELGIAHSTFDIHKRNLYKKAGAQSKGAFILTLVKERI